LTQLEILDSGHLTSIHSKQCILLNSPSSNGQLLTQTKIIVPANELEKLEASPATREELRLQLSKQNSEKEFSKTDWEKRRNYANQLLPL